MEGSQEMLRIASLNAAAPVLEVLDRAASAGFGTVLAPFAGLSPLRALAAAARARGMSVLADLRLDRVDVDRVGPALGVFSAVPAPSLDPRLAPAAPVALVPALDGPADVQAFAEWIGREVAGAASAGAAGVRLVGLSSLSRIQVPGLLAAVRRLQPAAVLFAWTHGLSWDVLQAIPPGAVDLVAARLSPSDGEASRLWQELILLRRIAPVIAEASASSGAHAAVAAMLADGWLAPAPDADGLENAELGAKALNRLRADAGFGCGPARRISSPSAPILALLRTDTPDPRTASHGTLVLVNQTAHPASAAGSQLLPETGAVLGVFKPLHPAGGPTLDPGTVLTLQPGECRLLAAGALPPVRSAGVSSQSVLHSARAPRLAIEAPTPCVDGGRFPARRTVGTLVEVQADIIGDGHDKLAAALRWKAPGGEWQEARMSLINNDRWTASFPLQRLGVHHYEIHAWRDAFTTYTDELFKKHKAGVPITLELQEGASLIAAAAARDTPARAGLAKAAAALAKSDPDAQREALLSPAVAVLMATADDRPHSAAFGPVPVQAERAGAGYASWYEVFPRSLSDDPDRHGTLRDVERHLPRIAAMGFDVLYFPPIHPIGRINRKGRNNTLTPAPDDPGSPYAIGSSDGGHDALHPELGTLEDFQHLRAAALDHGLELAMDFAIQCSPDHPWLKQHKDWFTWRPDGTIRYAENPPKRYEDIVNVDFYAPGAVPGLWLELCNVVLHWAGEGVRLFRVDNPHTKPLPFWEWMIAEVQAQYPDTVFLAEAFTRPKVMYRLAKCGFSQSYTYFTWREAKWEFEQYLTELTAGPAAEFFRPHFFVNTPDINPVYLQGAGRGAYLVRAALAATLSGLWGVYNGFELCEGTPVPGKEEYLDSEKYQLRAWDWDRPGNIVAEITQLNAIRRDNPALHSHLGVTFLPASGDNVLFFEKATLDRANIVLVAISMDAGAPQSADLTVPSADAVDLLTGQPARWADRVQRVTLPPDRPYAIWRLPGGQ